MLTLHTQRLADTDKTYHGEGDKSDYAFAVCAMDALVECLAIHLVERQAL